jgi:hypothetical protein
MVLKDKEVLVIFSTSLYIRINIYFIFYRKESFPAIQAVSFISEKRDKGNRLLYFRNQTV